MMPSLPASPQSEAELAHWRDAARSQGESDAHGWSLTTDDLRDRLASAEAALKEIAVGDCAVLEYVPCEDLNPCPSCRARRWLEEHER